MNKLFTLFAMLFAVVLGTSAKADIQVTTNVESLSKYGVAEVVVSMTNAEKEVRGLDLYFELPDDLGFVYSTGYVNEARFDGFNTQFKTGGGRGYFTAMSLSGAYVQGTEGEICRFWVRAYGDNDDIKANPDLYNFVIKTEVSYDGGKVNNLENTVKFKAVAEALYNLYSTEDAIELNDVATVTLNLKSTGDAYNHIGGVQFDVTLPEGMTIVPNEKGESEFVYGSAVSNSRFPLVKNVGENKVGVVVIDGKSGVLFSHYNDAEFVSFKVKGSAKLAAHSTLTISNIAVSDTEGNEYQNGDISIAVTNNGVIDNENAWVAIQASVQNVQDAIDNFDAVVATFPYASRYEGEEIYGPVDAARAWVEETLAKYQAKYEANELTAEDGVRGEAIEQVQNVNEALANAAKYDAYRHVQAVMFAWAGDEEDIEGYREDVLAVIATLPEAGQSALNEQIVLMEAAMRELLDEFETLGLYNEDDYKAIVNKSNDIMNNMKELVAATNLAAAENDMARFEELTHQLTLAVNGNEEYLTADDNKILEDFMGETYYSMIYIDLEEANENSTVYKSSIRWENLEAIVTDICTWIAINNQVANVKEAIANYETEVAKLPYASWRTCEEAEELIDGALAWVEATLAEAAEKRQDTGFLTPEDGKMGESMEQVANVYEALNIAGYYDAGRHIFGVINYWYGNEDEEIEGVKEGIMAYVATMPVAGQSAVLEQIELLEASILEQMQEYNLYAQYNYEYNESVIEWYNMIMANIADLLDNVQQIKDERAAENKAAFEADMALLAELQKTIIATYDGITSDWQYLFTEEYEALLQEIKEMAYSADQQLKSVYDSGYYVSVVDEAKVRETLAAWLAEEERQNQNWMLAMEDMDNLEALQAEWSAIIFGLEEVLTPEDIQFTLWLQGEELYIAMNEAYAEAFANGGLYVSPIDYDAIRAEMAERAAAIEVARVIYNDKAYANDLKLLQRLQNEYNAAINRIMAMYADGEDIEAEKALQDKLYALADACDEEYENSKEKVLYHTPLTDEVVAALRAEFEKLIEDAKNAVGINGISGVNTADAVYTLSGAKVETPVRGQVYIIKQNGVTKKVRF